MEGYYEAQVSFTHPAASRRFRQHGVYVLDADVVEALAPLIARGWLVPIPAHEAEGYVRIDPAPEPDDADEDENPAAQDPAGEGDGGSRPGEAPTPPASALSAGSPPSPVTEG